MSIDTSDPLVICSFLQYYIPPDGEFLSRNLTYLLPLIYVIPSLLLSIRIIFILLTDKKNEFSSSFYKLFLLASIVDLFWWIFYYLVYRLSQTPAAMSIYKLLPDVGFIDALLYFIGAYLMIADMLIPLMLSSNRFTAVVLPLHHKKVWEKISMVVIILFFFIPILFSWQIWLNDVIACKMHYNFTDLVYSSPILSIDAPSYGLKISMGMLIVSFFSAAICFIINAVTIIVMLRRRFSNPQNGKQETSKAIPELKLFLLSMLMFVNEVILGIIQIGFYFSGNNVDTNTKLFGIQNWVVDLICCTPPWFLIFMSSGIRQKIFGRTRSANNKIASTKTVNNKSKVLTITRVN